MKLKIGSRKSALAVAQAELLMDAIRRYDDNIELELVTMKTAGDAILDKTLDKIGGKGLFTKELERALLDGKIDLCVHSYKDMPMDIDPRLPVIALSARENARDVLILPEGCVDIDFTKPIGSSSARRSVQLKAIYPQAEVRPVRGNLLTRLKKLDSGEYGALVLAYAGIKRLKLEHRIAKVFSDKEIMPAAGQGILAVQGRSGESYDCLKYFDSAESALVSKAERAFIKALDGGCSSPTAAYAVIDGEYIILNGLYVSESTGEVKKDRLRVRAKHAEACGTALAYRMKYGTTGRVVLVGAGPHDRGLITVKGLNAIKQADCILYDRLIDPALLNEAPADCERIDVGKQCSNHTVPQSEVNAILLEKALLGKTVVRLKGGDPFLFGRGAEELELLRENGVPFEVIPGVTSAIAAPAYAGIPVTHRDFASSLHIVTGHAKDGKRLDIDYEALSRLSATGTLVFLMGVKNISEITSGLINAGIDKSLPAAVIENGTTARQRTLKCTVAGLAELAETSGVRSPAVIVVGKVAGLAGKFSRTPEPPLFGTKVAAAGHIASLEKMERMLYEKGCEVISYPCAETRALALPEVDFSLYDAVMFTSRQGVRFFFDGLRTKKKDPRALGDIKIATVGAETEKELNKYGMFADILPEVFDGEHLASEIVKALKPGGRILFAGAAKPSSSALDALAMNGFSVERLPVYETVLLNNKPLKLEDVDYVVFTSASTVEGFVLSNGKENVKGLHAVCIGNQTAKKARSYGMKAYTAPSATIESTINYMEEIVTDGKRT